MLNSKEFVRELQLRHESAWMNPNLESADALLDRKAGKYLSDDCGAARRGGRISPAGQGE